jgi:hypothetical protein
LGSYVGGFGGALLDHQAGGNLLGDLVSGVAGAGLGGALGYEIGDSTTDPDEIWFGTDPASKDFGARRFAVDDGPRPSLHDPAPAHSNYFNPEKDLQSATNIAKIVAGESDRIKVERWR